MISLALKVKSDLLRIRPLNSSVKSKSSLWRIVWKRKPGVMQKIIQVQHNEDASKTFVRNSHLFARNGKVCRIFYKNFDELMKSPRQCGVIWKQYGDCFHILSTRWCIILTLCKKRWYFLSNSRTHSNGNKNHVRFNKIIFRK